MEVELGTITQEHLRDWLRQSKPGDKLVYATTTHLTAHFPTFKLAREVWQMAVQGHLYLVQYRIPNTVYGIFDYIAVKASYPPMKRLVTSDYGLVDKIAIRPKKTDLEAVNWS
jgi:hypothetical protein